MIDVLIVGAGPVGTVLAVDLVRRGLAVRIIDKAGASFPGSRAKGVQPRTLEVFQDLGVLEDIRRAGGDYPLLGLHLGPVTLPWRMMAHQKRTADVPFPNTLLIPQFCTDQILQARLAALGGAVEHGRQFLDLTHDAKGVSARVSGPEGQIETITARYLVGADGGASAVRHTLGIDFIGSTHAEDRMVIIDAVTRGLSRERWHVWPGKSGQFIAACPLPHSDLFQWMIRLAPDETPPADLAAINQRIQKRISKRTVVLSDARWTSVFRPNIRLAKTYRLGRIFLAGDAAHAHTPAGAQGLNTGVQDAYNLGWKLGQVLAGADPGLLDSYQAERQPIAAAVLNLSTQKYEGIAKLDPSSIRRGKDEKQLALSYQDGPLAAGSAMTGTLRVGDRAPDAELRATNGAAVRLFDLLAGPHFTAIAYGDKAAQDLERLSWPAVGAPLQRLVINAKRLTGPLQGFKDIAGCFRRAYGLAGSALLLIRPDGYIGHIASQDLLPSTQAALARFAPTAGPISGSLGTSPDASHARTAVQ